MIVAVATHVVAPATLGAVAPWLLLVDFGMAFVALPTTLGSVRAQEDRRLAHRREHTQWRMRTVQR